MKIRIRIFLLKAFLILSLFQNVSCSSESKLRENLTGLCFWDIYDKRYTNFPIHAYKFYNNGEVDYLKYLFVEGNLTDSTVLIDDGDNIRPRNWDIADDRILNVRGYKMKILRYNSDSVF